MKKITFTLLTAILLVPVAAAAEPPTSADSSEQASATATVENSTETDATDQKPAAKTPENLPTADAPEPASIPAGPALRSTKKKYREYAYLNDECRREYGPAARVADWSDVKRMVKSRNEYENFLRTNDLNGKSYERLLYFNGKFKSPRDKHYYLIFNPDAETPNGINAIDRLRGNKLNLTAIMHIRAPILCFVP